MMDGDMSLEFLRLPTPDLTKTLIGLAFFAFLFALAIFAEYWRRRRAKLELVQLAWDEVRRQSKDKGLSEEQQLLLEELIKHGSKDTPSQLITERRRFDICVAQYMESRQKTLSFIAFRALGETLYDIRKRFGLDFVRLGQHIDSTRDLHAGQEITATRTKEKTRWMRLTLVSMDEAVMDMAVDWRKDEQPPSLRAGDEIRCQFTRPDDARYAFLTTLASVDLDAHRLLAFHSEEMRRIQARAFYRIAHVQHTSFGILSMPHNAILKDLRSKPVSSHFDGRIVNLSGGGVAAETMRSLPGGKIIRFTLDLHDTEPLVLHASVVACDSLAGGRTLLRASFVDIEDDERDIITHYVMRRQQAMLGGGDGDH